ncbi:hypothetical protein [Tepidiphilus baoligensis]|uniref:hypothetical protein n=1 Tax=Tepidiphilus baoligensis TaxID=2698687 RepID=UPI0019D55C5F|nr:hypothetical protein [Tepidiphilus baoligensis]
MTDMKQVLCMKWGTLYGADYVNKLYQMVAAQCSGPLRFVCLTDDPSGLLPEIEHYPCPEIPIEGRRKNTGWRKLTLYREREHLFGLEGDWLFLDLDVVITGGLDPFFSFQPEKSFIVMQNWTQPGKGIGNTSVVRFRVGAHPYLYDHFVAHWREVFAEHDNEQIYISRTIHELTFWPNEWCVLYKVQCLPPWPQRFWQDPVIPAGARIIAFPGAPDPYEAVKGEWPVKRWYKKLYKYTRPARWIETIWQDAEQKYRSRREARSPS